jgi:hypothetical protein
MAFQVSPGINTSEIDLTTVIPSISTTEGAIAGVFAWGPVGKFILVDSEITLTARYGKPSDMNFETFFTAANFLAYGSRLYVSRAAQVTGFSNTVSSISTLATTTSGFNPNQLVITGSLTAFTAAGVAAGYSVYGPGIPDGALVTSLTTANSGGGTVNPDRSVAVISANATAAATVSLNFSDPKYSFNAVAASNGTPAITRANYIVKNADHFETSTYAAGVEYIARYPGDLGNSLKVSVCDTVDQYSSTINPFALTDASGVVLTNSVNSVPSSVTGISVSVGSNIANVYIQANTVGTISTVTYNSGSAGVNLTPNTVTLSTNPYAVGDTVQFANSVGALPSPLANSTNYFVSYSSGLAIAVSATSGAANIALTPAVSGQTQSVIGAPESTKLTYSEAIVAATAMKNKLSIGDYIEVGNSSIGRQSLRVKAIGTPAGDNLSTPTISWFNVTFDDTYKLSTNYIANNFARKWEYYNTVALAPAISKTVSDSGSPTIDQMSVVVVDEDGKWSGVPGTVLEVYQNLSRATNAKNTDGTTNYYKTIINNGSRYIWAANDRQTLGVTVAGSANSVLVANSTATAPYTASFAGGADGATSTTISMGDLALAWDLFADPTSVSVSLLMQGKPRDGTNGTQLANYLIDNIAEKRKDCIVFVSPEKADVFGATAVEGQQAQNIIGFRNSLRSSSYAVLDSGYKYQYDKYNDVYRYIPLNGDIAGLTARTDDVRDPWFSPAGFNRGQIKNLVKLAYNPTLGDRDLLYKNDINPVVTFPGQGTVLFGDKTILGRPSAFDRINVRRLFIILEKTIATAAQSTLFEFNDEFTRAQFKNLVEPFLRDIQGRRGIYDFRVVCDETNNTPEIVDSNRFAGDIYVKPAKSINYIQLNFVAVRSGVEFTEVVGQF